MSIILVILVLLLVVLPIILLPDAEFEGADGQAEALVGTIQETYEPWFEPLFEPSGETESMLFALQAASGAGFIGYFFGSIRPRKKYLEANLE